MWTEMEIPRYTTSTPKHTLAHSLFIFVFSFASKAFYQLLGGIMKSSLYLFEDCFLLLLISSGRIASSKKQRFRCASTHAHLHAHKHTKHFEHFVLITTACSSSTIFKETLIFVLRAVKIW